MSSRRCPRQHWKAASGSFPILDVIETAVLSDGIHIAAMPRSSQPSRDTSRWGVFRLKLEAIDETNCRCLLPGEIPCRPVYLTGTPPSSCT